MKFSKVQLEFQIGSELSTILLLRLSEPDPGVYIFWKIAAGQTYGKLYSVRDPTSVRM